jgi:hypothetical protein
MYVSEGRLAGRLFFSVIYAMAFAANPPVAAIRCLVALYQIIKRLTLLPISQISRDLIQRCGGGFEMAAPVLLRGDF